ncbi:MAG: DNA translocase FtsK [Vicinamibacteria bacterium]|nr:DNA translocase FtsK [Vicinamibacteria bacterium]
MPSPVPATRATRVAEFFGLLSFALALMLLISLATYDPRDPAFWFKSGEQGAVVRNFIGPFGAFLAELFLGQLFGIAALVMPIALAVFGWKLFWCRPVDAPYTKLTGLALLLLSLTALLALTVAHVVMEGYEVGAGGAAGELLRDLLVSSFGRTGAFIVVCTTLIVSVILATQFSFSSMLHTIWGHAASRAAAIVTAWAHYREARRKEKLRAEVVRKHLQKEREKEPGAEGLTVPRVRRVARGANGDAEAGGDEFEEAGLDLDLDAEALREEPRAPQQKALSFTPEPTPAEPAARKRRSKATITVPTAPGAQPAPVPGGLPPTSLLDEPKPGAGQDKQRLFERARILQAKSGEFGVMGQVAEIHPGPVVTTYEFKPDAGVKYSKIVGLADDLALGLEAESIRIDRMSGKSSVGIEIPNEVRETISLREILESDAFRRSHSPLTLALGKTVSGDTYVTDLATMPHLLIAGATGTGKSVGLNCIISSILFKASPDEVRLILIDPKRLELGVYENIPHLLAPVVTDPKMAANVLKWAVGEMEKRIRRLAAQGVRNIQQFNQIIRAQDAQAQPGEELKPLHYIVIVIDELADLMMVSSNEVEEAITRLAQMARAVGIHLILATQRPSVDVITGLIKANFPSRISFRVSARVDSRTILDSIGAEQLLGKGDMLFLPPGSARLLRVHGAYVSEHEIARVTEHLRQTGAPIFDETVGKPEKTAEALEPDDRDELFDEAVRFVVSSGQASTSMLQRRFRIGFSRAGRLIDIMERDGIIGPADGSRPREILVAADYYAQVDAWPK